MTLKEQSKLLLNLLEDIKKLDRQAKLLEEE